MSPTVVFGALSGNPRSSPAQQLGAVGLLYVFRGSTFTHIDKKREYLVVLG